MYFYVNLLVLWDQHASTYTHFVGWASGSQVGWGIPPELFGPYTSGAVESVRSRCPGQQFKRAFPWYRTCLWSATTRNPKKDKHVEK
jgi:hypothetical protein